MFKERNLTFSAVRGPLSEERMRRIPNLTLPTKLGHGDPGFLLPSLYPELQLEKEKPRGIIRKNCLIAHLRDQGQRWLQNLTNIKVILPTQHWLAVVAALQTCDRVASSSLHGLIISDALGIPACWFHHKESNLKARKGPSNILITMQHFRLVPTSQHRQTILNQC